MTLKPVFAAAVSALTCLSANAAADLSGYTLSCGDTTRFTAVDLTFGDASNEGFGWNVANSVGVVSAGPGLRTATFALPSFTITAKPGFTLSGITGSLGNLVFNDPDGIGGRWPACQRDHQ